MTRVRGDLAALECERASDTGLRFRADEPALEFWAEERVQPQFLMHVVTTRFSCRIPGEGGGPARIRIRHRGAWKRTGIECLAERSADEQIHKLALRLSTDPLLGAALLPLDFTELEIERDARGWDVRLVHFGASEVVYRFPPIRQYVRLPPEQLRAMLETFRVLTRTPLHR